MNDGKKIAEDRYQKIQHPIPPLYDKQSRILILGSFPSVKSREAAFFYGHPQNRFWKLLAGLLSAEVPTNVEEKSEFLHDNHVAVWDTIASCEIIGSSDSSIRNVVPNDLTEILETADIRQIFCNGAKSYEYYKKYIQEKTGIAAVKLPSTSPANAACNMDKLYASWRIILGPLEAAPKGIGEDLLRWYDYNARILPWRSDPTPYHVWISEIMLQQTRVEAVKMYYDRWMSELPDIQTLSKIPDERLMKLWEGLGYYNRVRNIKKAAIEVMEEYEGELPADYNKLLTLKGIGEYTAGAISSIAFGLPKAAVDGNVLRVFSRILAMGQDIGKAKVKKQMEKEVLRVMPKDRAGDYNQALMDLGATVCLPNGQPLCDRCPWEGICQAHMHGQETAYPVKAKKKARRKEEMGVFLIETEDGIVLHKREKGGLLPDLWEFPMVSGTFTLEKARRQLTEWDLSEEEICPVGEAKHIFSHVEWYMQGYRIRISEETRKEKEDLFRKNGWIVVKRRKINTDYAVPSAFEKYRKMIIL